MVSLGDLSLAHWFSLYDFDKFYLSGVYLVRINIGSSPIRVEEDPGHWYGLGWRLNPKVTQAPKDLNPLSSCGFG